MARSYITLSPDLVEYADMAYEYLVDEGCRVYVEPAALDYPNTPTLLGKRAGGVEYVVEVAVGVDAGILQNWNYYGIARQKETYVFVVLPEGEASISTEELSKLRKYGVGLLLPSGAGVEQIVPARDLSINIGVPDLSRETKKLRRLLKPAFKKMADGEVVDGFKDAVSVLEDLARDNLIDGHRSGRVRFVNDKGKAISVTDMKISKMTLGQLATAYGQIVAPTRADDLTRRALESVKNDRNDASHRGIQPLVIRRIKRNAPKHAFSILNATRELV